MHQPGRGVHSVKGENQQESGGDKAEEESRMTEGEVGGEMQSGPWRLRIWRKNWLTLDDQANLVMMC